MAAHSGNPAFRSAATNNSTSTGRTSYAQQGRMYLNFSGLGEEGERLLRDTFGDSYGRLQAIKQKYDPGDFFRFNPNVQPAA